MLTLTDTRQFLGLNKRVSVRNDSCRFLHNGVIESEFRYYLVGSRSGCDFSGLAFLEVSGPFRLGEERRPAVLVLIEEVLPILFHTLLCVVSTGAWVLSLDEWVLKSGSFRHFRRSWILVLGHK